MIPSNRTATHPGVILLKEFLEPMRLTQKALAEHLNVSVQRINEVVRGKRSITSETAWLLGRAFGTTPEFWTNLQTTHDLSANRPESHVKALTPNMKSWKESRVQRA